MLLGIAALLVCAMLGVNGIVHGAIGNDAYAAPLVSSDRVPESVLDGGPVIDASRPVVRSYRVPSKTIALTFDDGPSPRWTPQILQVLRHYHVPATFFVIGSLAARYPDVIHDIAASGSELGLHTFTHPDLVDVPDWRMRAELAETQLAIAGATGSMTYLLRPPYSSSPDAIDNRHLAEIRKTAAQGYFTVLSTTDSEDWQRPGVDRIVANATPPDGRGATVLMHDAGGDRSQTVAALAKFIPKMRSLGYRFTTVSDAVGLPGGNRPASSLDHLAGQVLLSAVALSTGLMTGLSYALLAVGALIVLRLLLMLVVAGRHYRRRRRRGFRWGPPVRQPVSVIVPAYNEKANIAATVRSLVASRHPLEVIVVDDGSTDGTADIVADLRLPRVRVIRQPNAGKAAALNTGIAHARYELVVMLDGDTIFEPDTVAALVQPFAQPDIGAVAGYARVANRRSLLGACQHIEYVVGFSIDRRVYEVARCMPTVPGVIGAFRRRVLADVGGLSHDTLAEDTDLTMAICRAGWRVVYEPRARAHTEAPSSVADLWKQRYRWSYGTMQAMWKHRAAVREHGAAGRFGRLGLGQLALFQILLPLLSPLLDVFFIYGLIFLDPVVTAAIWLAVLMVQILAAVYAFRLERERLGVLLLMPLQLLIYRQLTCLVVVQSVLSALRGIRLRWNTIRRTGAVLGMLPAGAGYAAPATDRRPPGRPGPPISPPIPPRRIPPRQGPSRQGPSRQGPSSRQGPGTVPLQPRQGHLAVPEDGDGR